MSGIMRFFRNASWLPLVCAFAVTVLNATLSSGAAAQGVLSIDKLQVSSLPNCRQLASTLSGNESGGQWLIGSNIAIYGQPNGRTPISVVDRRFQHVSCYGRLEVADQDRVFVASDDYTICGWVNRSKLLDDNQQRTLQAFEQRADAVCPVPRAMSFLDFCSELGSLSSANEEDCKGVPAGLRAKGVLIGATANEFAPKYPFLTAPIGGRERSSKSFFSVLEIHDLDRDSSGNPLVLVGDGEGDIFGWIDLRALELWPTRLGLFYDVAGKGRMFQKLGALIQNWRTGEPLPDITPGLDTRNSQKLHPWRFSAAELSGDPDSQPTS